MTEGDDWLPPLVLLSEYDGNWPKYEDAIYAVFHNDFIAVSPEFRGVEVKYFRDPVEKGKVATFWHITTEGQKEDERTQDLRRCERIGWAKAVIEHADADSRVLVWQTERKGRPRMCLWLEQEDYVVILGRRGKNYMLITTFCSLTENRRCQFMREFEDYTTQNG